MKIWFARLIFFISLLNLIFVALPVNAEDINFLSSKIKIDGHWIYAFQQDDIKTFRIDEYFFINNTGDSVFNDSIYIWIQNNSFILDNICEDSKNSGCRYGPDGCMYCFIINHTGNNMYVGYPISFENKLSYFMQKESFTINAKYIINNSEYDNILNLNVTLGAFSTARDNDVYQGSGLHITSENADIGMRSMVSIEMPFNISTVEKITLFNNDSDDKLIDLEISNLPDGWNAEIWNETEQINNILLSSQEYKNLTLLISAPSYMATIYIGYVTELIEDEEKFGLFEKSYLYNTTNVQYLLYLLSKEKIKISEDITMIHPFSGEEPSWSEEYNRYWYVAQVTDVSPDSKTSFDISLYETKISYDQYLIWVLFIIIAIIAALIIFIKKDAIIGKQNTSKEKQSKEIADKKLNEEKIKELENKKKKVLDAIKRVEHEYDDGLITKENYEKVRDGYKKQAIDILKDIDKLKMK